MNHRATALAVCCALAAIAVTALADTQHLRPGDSLTYDLTIQVQQHASNSRTSANRTNNPNAAQNSSGTGAARIDIASVDADGTANGTLTVDLVGVTQHKPRSVHNVVVVKVAPAGARTPAARLDPLNDQMMALANQSIRDLTARQNRNGQIWHWSQPMQTYAATVDLERVARGPQIYQGLPTLIVQTAGGGEYAPPDDPVQAAMSLIGTDYYDQRDAIFVGEAMRSDSAVSNAASGDAIDSSALTTIQLRNFSRGPEVQSTPAAAPPAEQPSPPVQTYPTPLPTAYGPAPLPTVTPRPN